MNKRNENHCKKILEYLETHGSITNDEAIEQLRCYRLAARIFDLRIRGYLLETEMVYDKDSEGFPVKYARYKKVS